VAIDCRSISTASKNGRKGNEGNEVSESGLEVERGKVSVEEHQSCENLQTKKLKSCEIFMNKRQRN
jgi:hypothetical protein